MNVLLGLDGSELSMRALEQTVERARETGDSLTIAVYRGAGPADLDDVAAMAREQLTAAGLEAEVRYIAAEPASRLVELAEDGHDRLVLGGGTTSPMGKIKIGEVVEFVLANAQVTVTLVR